MSILKLSFFILILQEKMVDSLSYFLHSFSKSFLPFKEANKQTFIPDGIDMV